MFYPGSFNLTIFTGLLLAQQLLEKQQKPNASYSKYAAQTKDEVCEMKGVLMDSGVTCKPQNN